MPRKRGDENATTTATGTCRYCDPPNLRGGDLAKARHQHYLEYRTTEDLESHIRRHVPRFPAPPMGYDYDGWLQSVLGWHRQKLAWRAQDARREVDAHLPARGTEISRA